MKVLIRLLQPHEELPMQLLLLADPNQEFILSYIHRSHTFVAEKEGSIAGVLVLQPQGEAGELMNVAVDEQHQGQGIGRLLLEYAITLARAQGIKQLFVCTGNSSTAALALYKRCGFAIESIDKDYFLRTYPEPIFENGVPCTDRIKLRLALLPQPLLD